MIELKNISKNFKQECVLHAINLHIKKAECVVLSGVSGSGKSTLLSIMATLLKASNGDIKINTLDILSLNDAELSQHRTSTIGFVTQSFYLFEKLSVKDNLLASLIMSSLSFEAIESRLEYVMNLVNIAHKKHTISSKLSGGEKQRCMIARALLNEPKILLFDEPTANLDNENSLVFSAILKDLKQSGKTIVIATHDPFIKNLDFIDRIIKIKEGRLE
ncbi:MAG: ABC transporter ATP-binding protein [Sulfurimonas sp.]|nr:ABC transporter ATP-binding protein [Sulfurimonas sp.]MDQ7059929.1 ABC transporter ATP-binding protein [Sulfurimonas sp.]